MEGKWDICKPGFIGSMAGKGWDAQWESSPEGEEGNGCGVTWAAQGCFAR